MQSFDRSLNSHRSGKHRERWECWEGVRSLQPSTLALQVGWLVTWPYTVSGVPQRDCFSLSCSRVVLKAQRQSCWLCLKTMLMPNSFTQLSFASCKGSWEPEWGRCGPQSWEHRHFTGGAALPTATLHGHWVSMAICPPHKPPVSKSTFHQEWMNREENVLKSAQRSGMQKAFSRENFLSG